MTLPTKEEIYEELCRRHGTDVQKKLANARVAIAGLGGLGSTITIALVRAGVGHLHLIDFDKVDLSNLNRQQYRLKDLGRYKTEALWEEIRDINPYLDICIDTIKITPDNYTSLFNQTDIVCEAFDRPEAKSMLVDCFFTHKKPHQKLVSATGMAGYQSGNLIRTRRLSSDFYLCGDGISGIDTCNGLMAPRVGICAAQEAHMILRLILGETEA